MRHDFRQLASAAIMACLALACAPRIVAQEHHGPHSVFLVSAHENEDFTRVTLPLYKGTSGGNPVWYVITDSSSKKWAKILGVNYAPKLANTAGGLGSQKVNGDPISGIDFPGTVDFSPRRELDIGDYGECSSLPFLPFGPGCFAAGAVGDSSYSPLIELNDGTVLNASHIANHTGKADKATINASFTTATFDETTGGALGYVVHYFSVDASVVPGAVLENVTYAAALANTPKDPLGPSDENASHLSSREGIIAFTNELDYSGWPGDRFNRGQQYLATFAVEYPATGSESEGGPGISAVQPIVGCSFHDVAGTGCATEAAERLQLCAAQS